MRLALFDVGGTLWPDRWPARPGDNDERVARLCDAVPGLSALQASELVAALSVLDHPHSERQETEALVTAELRRLGLAGVVPPRDAIHAMSLAARGRVEPFPGASELLGGLVARGVRVVLVSNVLWRDGATLRRDFEDLGLAAFVSAYVTSVDVGWRKPHPRIFDAALAVCGYPSPEGAMVGEVMVGDSEANDIAPARARGMLTIRVAIEEPVPLASAADVVCGSLHEVADVLLRDGS
jgi:FMN phosphatase YigB (HAD superfamily)